MFPDQIEVNLTHIQAENLQNVSKMGFGKKLKESIG